MVEASLNLARSLGIVAVAEGVQYRVDWNVLAELGCDVVQGYYVSPPISEAHLATWESRLEPFRESILHGDN